MTTIGSTITTKDLAQRCIHILPLNYDEMATTLNTNTRNLPLNFQEFNAILLEDQEWKIFVLLD